MVLTQGHLIDFPTSGERQHRRKLDGFRHLVFRQLGHSDAIKLWDATVQYTSACGQWYVRAFGENLGDCKYYVSRVPFSATCGVGLPAQPRTWGITLGYSLN